MDTPEQRDKTDKSAMSMIGADIVVTGNIEAKVDLHIEGRVNGDVRCATLILGENSSVNGSVYADRVRVSGTVDGSVETKDLAVEATARVVGDVTYDRLRVANGGVIEGNMKRRPVEEGSSGAGTSNNGNTDAGKLKLVGPTAEPAPARAVFIE
jgi:cytoskeletal protein CcmA (bactofilin family)